MKRLHRPAHAFFRLAAGAALAIAACGAHAHGGQAGAIRIVHPYAVPTPPGAVNGAAYIAELENTGHDADRLTALSTPVAERAEIHTMGMDAAGVMRMRQVPALDIAPGTPVRMKPGAGYHLMLIGLKQPLKDGDRFPLTMTFEHGGQTQVDIVVRSPKPGAAAMDDMPAHHAH